MIPVPAAFEAWLGRQPGFARARVRLIEPVDGGASNLTCRVEIEGAQRRRICLRIERERGIFEPYDVVREGRVIAALAASPIPVPALLASESGRDALGARFIVLEWIDAPHMGNAGPEANFAAFTEAVAAIHALDWRVLGLDFLGVPADPGDGLRAELAAIARRMPGFGCGQEPVLRRAVELLHDSAPGNGELRLCQGDINVFNYLFRKGEVVGIVDWEQARISDPRSDVGHLVALSHLKGAPFGDPRLMPFVHAYETASGRRLDGMEWFRARWLFELAVIYHGWVKFNGTAPWYSWPEVSSLLERALSALG